MGGPTDACSAYPEWASSQGVYAGRLLKALSMIQAEPISPRRRASVGQAVKAIADTRDPVPVLTAILGRAGGKANRGAYVATAVLEEGGAAGDGDPVAG